MHENGEATTVDVEAARDALEKFVMENDDLLDLEAKIGRFNIFDALGIVNAEIRHSNFLGWLLDPAESHGAGDLFLKAVLMDMLRQTNQELRPKGVSPIHLDGAAITSVDIRREWKNIDLLIRCESPRLVIAIENKIRSGEHGGQLLKYKKIVREAFPDDPSMFVFLTREGDEPSDDDWTTYSYARLKSVLERVRKTNEGAIGEDVDTFLDHYLHLIESRLMEDQVIDDLCRKIYKNHRRAVDLIVSRSGGVLDDLFQVVSDVLSATPDRWRLLETRSKEVLFMPARWFDILPPICTWQNREPRAWLYMYFWAEPKNNKCGVYRAAGPTTDDTLRTECIQRLLDGDFGMKRRCAILKPGWVSLGKHEIYSWNQHESPDLEQVRRAFEKHLDKLWEKVKDSHLVLRDAIKNVETQRGSMR